MPFRLWVFFLLGVSYQGMISAQPLQPSALPEPLSLEYALSLAEQHHPDLLAAKLDIEQSLAVRQELEAASSLSASLNGRARWLGLPNTDGTTEDHALGISIKKPLYDFGVSEQKEQAATLYEASSKLIYQSKLENRRQDIMRRYFDVLLADLEFFRENERMAGAFIRWDRARKRQSLGLSDDLEILKLERIYQKVRKDRYTTQGMQRVTRARLALALNRPGMLPSTLSKPALPQLERKVPDVELMQAWARQHNPTLRALQKRYQAAQAKLEAARSGSGLKLDAEVGVASYTMQPASRDDWRVGINFNYPLYSGGRDDAKVAKALTEKYKSKNNFNRAVMDIEQAILEVWTKLGSLKIEREEMLVLNDYQGLNLDHTRIIYEQGLQTSLGTSMVEVTNAEWMLAKTEYQMAVLWLQLEGLIGLPFESFPQQEKKQGQ
ncbi:MAG: TolC family protein [Gammaproteobacteria bacterium]|nr:TolC family protein [Gammaproteobacteria bacterium]